MKTENTKLYVKKPIPIEALQYTGENFDELLEFSENSVFLEDGEVYVDTLEGTMKMKNKVGDYLIRGIKGEYYFCEKLIFEESYERVQK